MADRPRRKHQHRLWYPSAITYGQLLMVFFSVAHDPTQWNRQGPGTGSQYRSAIFYTNEEQRRIAQTYIAQLRCCEGLLPPIVTKVEPFQAFYPAESYIRISSSTIR